MSAIGSIFAGDVRHIGMLETAHHMRDRIDFADVGEELITETFALRRAAHQAGNVNERQSRRHDLYRLGELGKFIEPRIGNRHLAHVGLDGAERIVRGLRRRRFGQRVEQRGLAHVRQADNAAFKTHGVFRKRCVPVDAR